MAIRGIAGSVRGRFLIVHNIHVLITW